MRNHRHLTSIWALPIVMLLILGGSFTWFSNRDKEQAVEQEFRSLESNARIASALIGGLLHSVEHLLDEVAEEQWRLSPAERARYDGVLAQRMGQFPEIRSLVVINGEGRVELTADPKLKGFDSSRRDYFVAHLARPLAPNIYVSRPFKTAIGNDMGIAFSVALRDQGNAFRGMVVSGVNPKYFESVLDQVLPQGEGTTATLFNSYGDVVYRIPNPERYETSSVANNTVAKAHFSAHASMTRQIGVSVLDGRQRIYAISRVGTSTLNVALSRPYADVLVNWRRNVVIRVLIFLLSAAVTISLTWVAQRRQRDLQQAERSARREQRFSDDIIDSLPGVFYMLDSKGEFLRWNSNMLSASGYPVDALKGKPAIELIAETQRQQVAAAIRKVFRSGEVEVEAGLLAKDGGITPHHFTGSLIHLEDRDYLVGLGNDISASKKAEEQLNLAASIFHASSEGMMIADANNCIIAVNPAFTRMTGYAVADLVGKNPSILHSGLHDADFYRKIGERLDTTGEWRGEVWDRNKDGRTVAKRLTINIIYAPDGTVSHRIVLSSDITDQKQAEETIWRQANFDELTGLPNRRLFGDRLDQEIRNTGRREQLLALLFIDIDHFKDVNDTRGHQAGDRLLQEAARRIVLCVRESDTVARLGGDEFTVMLAGVTDTLAVERVSQAILRILAQPFLLDGTEAYMSASIGITLYPADAHDSESLLKNADQAMYAAKGKGRNCYCFFVPVLQALAQERQHLLRDLRGALAGGQLAVHYQPIVELATNEIHKAEALLRWKHPQRGLIPPMDFIPLAEETGLIHDIGDWVLREACGTVKRWQEAYRGSRAVQISVNKSPRQFVKRPVDVSWVQILGEFDLAPKCIAVEITEGLLLDTRIEVTDKLGEFHDNGIEISLDDFGTGYSALAYLKKFPIDYLKIDKSFVRDMATDSSDQAIIEAIIAMAHKLGLKVIAEGVETPEQRARLLAAGCDYAQGYLFARPIPGDEFLAQMASPEISEAP